MVKPIICFLHGKDIRMTAFMDNSTNQARCRCKVIFQIHVIALLFMCCGWSIYWVKMILEPTGIPRFLGFLWDTLRKTITLPKDKTTQVEAWAMKLLAVNQTTKELGIFCGILNQHHSCCMEDSPQLQGSPKIFHYFSQRM